MSELPPESVSMSEIIAVIGLSTLGIYAITVGGAWAWHGNAAGPHLRAAFVRWAAYSALFTAAVAAWVVAGIAAILFGTEFWRGAWAGGSAIFGIGYFPALFWMVRSARQQELFARLRDANVH
jgi:hypothetical protein